jgi:hypothetical protein
MRPAVPAPEGGRCDRTQWERRAGKRGGAGHRGSRRAAGLFLILTIPCLALPAIYPLAVGLVFVACALAASAVFTGSQNLFTAAGATALTFAFLAFYAWVHVALKSVGRTALPPLGRPVLR